MWMKRARVTGTWWRRLGRAGLLGVLLGAACGGGNNPELCEDIIEKTCARREECTSGRMKQADCAAEARKATSCAQPDRSCPQGKRYSGSVASQCVSALATASCADILAGKVTSCNTVCQ